MLHDKHTAELDCPCGSGKHFIDCCEPAIEGARPARTAEQLMRSRYSAFALGMIDYLMDTTHPDHRQGLTSEVLEQQSHSTTWLGLKILETEAGGEQDTHGRVRFVAQFSSGDQQAELRENSRFERLNDHWYYVDGDVTVVEKTVESEVDK